jgi:hypothetical protein
VSSFLSVETSTDRGQCAGNVSPHVSKHHTIEAFDTYRTDFDMTPTEIESVFDPKDAPSTVSAACLLAWLTLSITGLLINHWQRWKHEGGIQLPRDAVEGEEVTRKAVMYKQLLDQMAPDLQEDGDPVNEAEFWRQVGLSIDEETLRHHNEQQAADPHRSDGGVESSPLSRLSYSPPVSTVISSAKTSSRRWQVDSAWQWRRPLYRGSLSSA